MRNRYVMTTSLLFLVISIPGICAALNGNHLQRVGTGAYRFCFSMPADTREETYRFETQWRLKVWGDKRGPGFIEKRDGKIYLREGRTYSGWIETDGLLGRLPVLARRNGRECVEFNWDESQLEHGGAYQIIVSLVWPKDGTFYLQDEAGLVLLKDERGDVLVKDSSWKPE